MPSSPSVLDPLRFFLFSIFLVLFLLNRILVLSSKADLRVFLKRSSFMNWWGQWLGPIFDAQEPLWWFKGLTWSVSTFSFELLGWDWQHMGRSFPLIWGFFQVDSSLLWTGLRSTHFSLNSCLIGVSFNHMSHARLHYETQHELEAGTNINSIFFSFFLFFFFSDGALSHWFRQTWNHQ